MDGADGGRGGMIPPPSLFPMRLKIPAGASAEVQKLETKREGETKATRTKMRRSDARHMIMAGLNTWES